MRACGAADYVAIPLHDMIAESRRRGHPVPGPLRGGVLEHHRHRPARHRRRDGPRDEEAGHQGPVARGHRPRQRPGAVPALHQHARPGVHGVRPVARSRRSSSKFRGRSEMIDYCNSHKLPIKASKDAPYSTDANLLGLTHEAGKLEHLDHRPVVRHPRHGRAAEGRARYDPETVTVRFEKGRPVAINGKKTTAFQAIQQANAIGGKHGVGICTHLVENRFVGIKSRGVYEAPGMELLGTRLRVPAATRSRPPRPGAVRPAVAVRREADLPGLRVRPGDAHGPRGDRADQRTGDRHDHAEAVQGPGRVRSRRRTCRTRCTRRRTRAWRRSASSTTPTARASCACCRSAPGRWPRTGRSSRRRGPFDNAAESDCHVGPFSFALGHLHRIA